MNVCLVAFALTLGCAGAPTRASDPAPTADRWFAEDKLRHLALSFAATEMGYGAARIAVDRRTAAPLAASAAFALGLAKEVRDARAGGSFSAKDLAWDLAGVALGVALVHRIR